MMRHVVGLLLLFAAPVMAQVIETPVPFDSAGRVMALTPEIAARLSLGPPAWRVVGDYSEARLYSLGGGSYVLAVTRRDGAVERYSLTEADRQYLYQRTSTLPPSTIRARGERGAFLRDQTLLGLLVYAPAFAAAITDDDAGGVSAYLLMAGATFFGASQVARDFTITPAMRSLSTNVALHGAAAGGALAWAFEANDDAIAAATFVGGIGGTVGGLIAGNRMTGGEAAASGFGADVAALTMLGGIASTQGGENLDELKRLDAVLLVGAAAVGYPLGYMYPRSVSYKVTEGDVGTLWVSGLVGASTAGVFLADGNLELRSTAIGLTAGFLGGIVAGDRLLVRRYDHSPGDATMLGLGGIAGGLIGLGIANLIDDDEDPNDRLAAGLFTAGAAGGVGITHNLIAPGRDTGRFSSRLRFNPAGAAFAAAGVTGRHSMLSLSF